MDKIYQEILEAIELKKENEAKIAELESKIRENIKESNKIENSINFSMNKDSLENQVEARRKQNLDIENSKMNMEKQSFENEVNGEIDAIKSKLQNMIAEERQKLEENEKSYGENAAMENWNSFYGEELFENAQASEVEEKSFELLANIKNMESIYNQLSSKDIEKLTEEAEKNSEKVKEEEPKTVEQNVPEQETKTVEQTVKTDEFKPLNPETVDMAKEQARKEQMDYMRQLQQKLIQRQKEQNLRICKDVFAKKEKGFEDVLTLEYEQLKNSILALVDKNPNKLREIMYKISDMTIEDIYEDIIKTVKQQGNEDKAKNIAKNLEKIKARRKELNPKKDEPKKDEPKKEEAKKDEAKKDESKKDEAKKDESKKDEAKKDEPKKDEAKKDEAKKDEPKKDEAKKDEAKKDEPKKDEAKKDESKKDEAKKDEAKKDESKKDEPKKDESKPFEKTSITVDASHSKIVICIKGKTEPLEYSNRKYITGYIKNGKEYKNMKDENKERVFDRKAVKKVDPAILGILVEHDMDAAKEYVNAFKSENATSIDLKYTFGEYYEANVPMTTINNYERFAKKAEKSADATVEGLKKGPIGRFMDWRNARKAKKLEAAKEGKPTFGEKVQTYLFDEFGEERNEKIAEYKKSKQENEPKKDFKDEMKKDAPTPEEQAKTAKEFGEKEKQNGKATKRERKSLKTKETEK